MSKEDDDVSTIVLDFNNLKSKLDEKEDIIEDEATMHDLAFTTDMLKDSTATSLQNLIPKKEIFLFCYKTKFFNDNNEVFSLLENTTALNDIKELNKAITDSPDGIFIMYFNDTPKAINQISEQIKRKFENAKSIIIAKNLSAAKAKQHAGSKYGADAYLNDPFSAEDLENKLQDFFK